MLIRTTRLLLPLLVGAGTLAGCAGSAAGQPAIGRLAVVTSFYPLQYAVQRIAGPLADVADLTKPGAEPHDLELTPRDVASVADAKLVVYLSGFQPSVDRAVQSEAKDRSLDVAAAARLTLDGVGESGAAGRDPHFWLDPTRLADVGDAIARRLSVLSPAHAATFSTNAAALRADLTTLDGEFTAGLAHCANPNLVTSHEAFGYLAQRYGLHQVGITGLTPEAEPDAGTLARVADFVRAERVRTIYYETLVSPAIADTVATSTGAATAVLDPIEGISDASAARDYLGVMRADLAALRSGQPCA